MDLIVTIVRHGNTFEGWQQVRRIGTRTDLPLVASGFDQADALGLKFAEEGLTFDRALAAPLQRTRATVDRILARQRQVPVVESTDWLTEIDHGPDEGRTEAEVVARIGEAALAAWDEEARAPADWSVDADARRQGWGNLLRTDGNVLVVTSNGAARFALLSDPALHRQAADLPSLKLRTGAYGVIARRGDTLRLLAWDRRP